MYKTYKDYCENELGYKVLYTFYEDFTIADRFGPKAVKETYARVLKDAKIMGYKALTELTMVLNHKIWFLYKSNKPLAQLYNELWEKTEDYCYDNLKGDELTYFYHTLD